MGLFLFIKADFFVIAFIIFLSYLSCIDGTVERCQQNCEAADRLTGPTRMLHTLPHPYKITQFPTKNSGFCKLGCQYFFSEYPNNVTCKNACNYAYRYRVTTGYSDVTEESILNCRDGCDIALQICQAGFYCNNGGMFPCQPGTFRTAATGSEVLECSKCPHGRYRVRDKGKSADECQLCPIGKYANVTGSVTVTECLRCPAGKVRLFRQNSLIFYQC
jgi:hypothetical protein